VFSVRSVLRPYNEERLAARTVGAWCEMAASLGNMSPETEERPPLKSVTEQRHWKQSLYYSNLWSVVTRCIYKNPVNLVTISNPAYIHLSRDSIMVELFVLNWLVSKRCSRVVYRRWRFRIPGFETWFMVFLSLCMKFLSRDFKTGQSPLLFIAFKSVIRHNETNNTTPTELLIIMQNKLQIKVKLNIVVQLQVFNDFGQ
jgi:hypothetical protein